jgi:hypothetical protein
VQALQITKITHKCALALVRLDDAAPWEASISAERDEATGRPIVFLSPEGLYAGA